MPSSKGAPSQKSFFDQARLFLLKLPRRRKRLIQVATDILLVWFALWLAFLVRLGIDDLYNPIVKHVWLFIAAPIVAIPLFIRFGMYRAVMRYFGNDALITIVKAVTLSSLILALVVYWYSNHTVIVPRSIIFNYWWLSLVILGGLRLGMRHYFINEIGISSFSKTPIKDVAQLRVAIYGAGTAGNQLLAALRLSPNLRPVAFIDDDPEIANRIIAGLQVFKPKHIERMIAKTGAQEVLLALPSATSSRRREILAFLEAYPLHVRSVPALADLASGRVKVDDIREIDISDLLGRDSVPADDELLGRCVTDQVVMVTGAGGSIGGELCRQIVGLRPQTLILFDSSEFNLYSISESLNSDISVNGLIVRLIPILGSVRDPDKLLAVMRRYHVSTVYHAAAYKHVPIVEHNVSEGINNNVLGTLHAAQSALRAGVGNFVLISTDKAVRPTNVMGGTKRLAEMILQALNKEPAPVLFGDVKRIPQVNRTRFSMVRFGNVLGSSGSVIPLFHRQIKSGGPLTVTHPKITRYFMTIPEAAQLVIQAGSMGQGGDVYVLDMGEPVRIVELAEKMIRLSGLSVRSDTNPQGDIAIEFTGLRPGEKLYEELLIGDNVLPTAHPMIMCANEDFISWEPLKQALARLLEALQREEQDEVRLILRSMVTGYRPECEIVDWLYTAAKNEQPGL